MAVRREENLKPNVNALDGYRRRAPRRKTHSISGPLIKDRSHPCHIEQKPLCGA